MPQLSIQLSSVDNHGNPRAKRATYATVIPRNLCAGEMPTQLATDDGNLGSIPEREHKKLPHANEGVRRGNHQLMAWGGSDEK